MTGRHKKLSNEIEIDITSVMIEAAENALKRILWDSDTFEDITTDVYRAMEKARVSYTCEKSLVLGRSAEAVVENFH